MSFRASSQTGVGIRFSCATAFSAAPKIVNKSLSGKYAKLNAVEKYVKKITTGPQQGKYSSDPNYIADLLYYGTRRARNKILIEACGLGVKHAEQYVF